MKLEIPPTQLPAVAWSRGAPQSAAKARPLTDLPALVHDEIAAHLEPRDKVHFTQTSRQLFLQIAKPKALSRAAKDIQEARDFVTNHTPKVDRARERASWFNMIHKDRRKIVFNAVRSSLEGLRESRSSGDTEGACLSGLQMVLATPYDLTLYPLMVGVQCGIILGGGCERRRCYKQEKAALKAAQARLSDAEKRQEFFSKMV